MSATLKLAAISLSLAALAPAAFAESRQEQVSFRVAYGDLDMSAPANGAKLLDRIELAARKVCSDAIPRSPLFQREAISCRQETVASAVRSLDLPVLTAAWGGKYATTTVAAR